MEVLRAGLRPAERGGRDGRARRPGGAGAPAQLPRYVDDQALRHIVDLDEYYVDLEQRTPARRLHTSRPPRRASIRLGGSRPARRSSRALLTALARSDAWDSSAFLWTYDESGGWFDHVPPAAGGSGFRVPALLVSPYARRGYVDSTGSTPPRSPPSSSDNWELSRSPARHPGAQLRGGLRLLAAAARAEHPRRRATPAARRGARRSVIYIGYGAALAAGRRSCRLGRRCAADALRASRSLLAACGARRPAAAQAVVQPIQTVPPVPGMRFSLDGIEFQAGRRGREPAHPRRLARCAEGARHRDRARDPSEVRPLVRRPQDRRDQARLPGQASTSSTSAASRVDPRMVSVGRAGAAARAAATCSGARAALAAGQPGGPARATARSRRPSPTRREGAWSAARRSCTRANSASSRPRPAGCSCGCCCSPLAFEVRDALLGFPIGSAVRLEYPNGREQRHALGPGGGLTLRSLPRGDYRVSVDALGHLVLAPRRPVHATSRWTSRSSAGSMSRWCCSGWPRSHWPFFACAARADRARRRSAVRVTATLLVALGVVAAPGGRAASRPDPLFAYYYIWFNADSWNRAKTDYPLLGRYSSDDADVMRKHVQWAKQAGIDGFIVSWKSTPVLNRRLERLAEVAEAERFKLLVIYQGLDFEREPLPASRVARDLGVFSSRFADGEAFEVFAKPLVDLVRHAGVHARAGGERHPAVAREASDSRLGAQCGRATGGWRIWWTATPTTGARSTPRPIRATRRSSRRWARPSMSEAAYGSPPRRPASTPVWSAARALFHAGTARPSARSSTQRRRRPRTRSASSAGTSSARTPTSSRVARTARAISRWWRTSVALSSRSSVTSIERARRHRSQLRPASPGRLCAAARDQLPGRAAPRPTPCRGLNAISPIVGTELTRWAACGARTPGLASNRALKGDKPCASHVAC